MALTHQTARWLDEPARPLGKYRYVDQLSLAQCAGALVGLLAGAIALWVTLPLLGIFALSVGIIAAVVVGGALILLMAGRKEPYARQLGRHARRRIVRMARAQLKRPVASAIPVADDAGVVEWEG